jgi:hypothetical protein
VQQKIVIAGSAVLAVALIVPAAAVIFSGGGGDDGSSRCARVQNLADAVSDQASQSGADADQAKDALASVIVGAPECFAPVDVDRAHQRIDMINAR